MIHICLKDSWRYRKSNSIIKAGVYNDEIEKDILENINANTLFWE